MYLLYHVESPVNRSHILTVNFGSEKGLILNILQNAETVSLSYYRC